MGNLDLSTIELVSTLRAAPQNGSPSSQDYNDSWTEALADLAALSGFVNDIVIPLMNGLSSAILPNPNGIPSGIEGRFIFSDTTDLTPLFFDTLASTPLSLADSLRILQGIIQTVQISIGTLNVEVTALQTQLSSTNQNDIAQALQNFAASLQSLSSQTVANTTALAEIPIMETDGVINPVQSTLNLKHGNGITLTNFGGDVTIDGVVLKTNNTPNSTQTLLNLKAGANVALVEVAGTVTISSSGGSGIILETNSTPNSTQSLLNLQAGTNISIAEVAGTVTISSTSSGDASKLQGNNISSATPLDQQVLQWSVADNQYDLVYADGLEHGDPIFPIDCSVQRWFDDFTWGGFAQAGSGSTIVNGASGLGELSWDVLAGAGSTMTRTTPSIPPHVGTLTIQSGTTSTSFSSVFWRGGSGPSSGGGAGNLANTFGMPLFDYPAWKMVWVFGFPVERVTSTASPFPLAKKSLYVGLAPQDGNNGNGGIPTWAPANSAGNPRPPFFAGLRFDTDPGSGALALTSVANASGGNTVYTGSGLTLTVNAWIGTNFTVAGFTNGVNNGTFICVANSATTLTLKNASGVAETNPGTATGPSLNDTNFQFETVSNSNVNPRRINNPGTVIDTGITPTEGTWYRLEMTFQASGSLVMKLSGGGSTFTHTFTSVPTTSCTGNNNTTRGNGLGGLSPGANQTSVTSNHAWAIGSVITMSGMGQTFYNGTFTIIGQGGGASNTYMFVLAGASDTTANPTPTVTGYPGVVPYFAWGNSSEATPVSAVCAIDLFSMVWDTSLATSPQTLDTTRARYVPGT